MDQPTLNFDLGGAASILDLPGLNSLLKDAIHDQIGLNMILPSKITVMLSDKAGIKINIPNLPFITKYTHTHFTQTPYQLHTPSLQTTHITWEI